MIHKAETKIQALYQASELKNIVDTHGDLSGLTTEQCEIFIDNFERAVNGSFRDPFRGDYDTFKCTACGHATFKVNLKDGRCPKCRGICYNAD